MFQTTYNSRMNNLIWWYRQENWVAVHECKQIEIYIPNVAQVLDHPIPNNQDVVINNMQQS